MNQDALAVHGKAAVVCVGRVVNYEGSFFRADDEHGMVADDDFILRNLTGSRQPVFESQRTCGRSKMGHPYLLTGFAESAHNGVFRIAPLDGIKDWACARGNR